MLNQPISTETKKHYQFFDAVRIIITLCVILYHAVKAYSTTTPDHPIHDINPVIFSNYVRWIFDVFMMPLFFFVAGFFVLPSLRSKSPGPFIINKVKRIGVPWLAVTISLCALVSNFGPRFESAFKHQEIVSFGDVLIDMLTGFTQIREAGFGGNQMHLWFSSLLLFFFIVYGFIYKLGVNRIKFSSSQKSGAVPGKSAFPALLIFGALMSVLYFIVVIFFPKINDWFYLGFLTFEPSKIVLYVGYFSIGIYGYSRNWFTDNVKMGRTGFWTAILALSLAGFLISGKEILIERAIPDNFPLSQLVLFATTRSFFCLSVLVLLTLLAGRYWKHNSKFTKKLSDNSYHIYIIHMFIVIGFHAALVNWKGGSTWIKLIIVFFSAAVISYLISEYITNRFPKITVAALLLISISLVFIINPHRNQRQFDQRQLVIQDKLAHINTDHATLRNDAILSFKKAVKNPPQGLVEAFEKLSLAHHSRKTDYEIMSYLGRATVMMAIYRVVNNPMEFMVYDANGFKWLDNAVENDPDNVNIRLNRAVISITVVKLLDREKCAKTDFEYLAQMIRKNPAIDASIKEQVYSNLGKIYKKSGNNRKSEINKKSIFN